MALKGKGMYVWQVARCERGETAAIAALARAARLTHVLVKVADRDYAYNVDPASKADLAMLLVQSLRAQGIHAWGWQYVMEISNCRSEYGHPRIASLTGWFVVHAEIDTTTGKEKCNVLNPWGCLLISSRRSTVPCPPISGAVWN